MDSRNDASVKQEDPNSKFIESELDGEDAFDCADGSIMSEEEFEHIEKELPVYDVPASPSRAAAESPTNSNQFIADAMMASGVFIERPLTPNVADAGLPTVKYSAAAVTTIEMVATNETAPLASIAEVAVVESAAATPSATPAHYAQPSPQDLRQRILPSDLSHRSPASPTMDSASDEEDNEEQKSSTWCPCDCLRSFSFFGMNKLSKAKGDPKQTTDMEMSKKVASNKPNSALPTTPTGKITHDLPSPSMQLGRR